ncbi:MAG: hypothetical protein GY780_01530 [bacterium]|nr:hypothetical protein [bacterium]
MQNNFLLAVSSSFFLASFDGSEDLALPGDFVSREGVATAVNSAAVGFE